MSSWERKKKSERKVAVKNAESHLPNLEFGFY
jgi:hypothetical protein